MSKVVDTEAKEIEKEEPVNKAIPLDGEATFTPKLTKPASSMDIESPFEAIIRKSELRFRAGWHQTWIRGEDVDKMRGAGFRIMRKQKLNKYKQPVYEEPGYETGEIIEVLEGDGNKVVAMECPEELHTAHVNAMSAKSRRLYTDDDTILSGFTSGTNRDLTSRKEQVHVSTDMEHAREVVHSRQ
jgi:hypothetical protein